MKSFKNYIFESAKLVKKSSYRGRTTADVEWEAHDKDGNIVRVEKTKKAAQVWVDMYNMSKEEFFKKYPHLKAPQ